ncbi:hypothetical protein ACLOJK_024541 [Asimina triloba]
MPARRIAPAAIVVRWAEIGGCDGDSGAAKAPLGVLPGIADQLKACSAGLAASEEGAAQGCSVDAKPSLHRVVIPTCTSFMHACSAR